MQRRLPTFLVLLCLALCAGNARAETVAVKDFGPVDLTTLTCTDVTSSFVRRICTDQVSYLVLNVRGTYRHYCRVPWQVVDGLIFAPSVGQYYLTYIRGRYPCS